MNLDWGLLLVACMVLVLGALIGFVAASGVGRWLDEEEIEATYAELHQHVHSTLGLKPPKGNT